MLRLPLATTCNEHNVGPRIIHTGLPVQLVQPLGNSPKAECVGRANLAELSIQHFLYFGQGTGGTTQDTNGATDPASSAIAHVTMCGLENNVVQLFTELGNLLSTQARDNFCLTPPPCFLLRISLRASVSHQNSPSHLRSVWARGSARPLRPCTNITPSSQHRHPVYPVSYTVVSGDLFRRSLGYFRA